MFIKMVCVDGAFPNVRDKMNQGDVISTPHLSDVSHMKGLLEFFNSN